MDTIKTKERIRFKPTKEEGARPLALSYKVIMSSSIIKKVMEDIKMKEIKIKFKPMYDLFEFSECPFCKDGKKMKVTGTSWAILVDSIEKSRNLIGNFLGYRIIEDNSIKEIYLPKKVIEFLRKLDIR